MTLLASDLPSLVDLSDKYFARLTWSSILVAVGVALEGPEVVLEFSSLFSKRFHRESPQWLKTVGLVGWLLVVVGVVGEGWFELRAARVEADIRAVDNARIDETSRKALAADNASDHALEEAKQLNERTAALTKRTEIGEQRTVEVARAILPRVFTNADELWLTVRTMECQPRFYPVRLFASRAGNLNETVEGALTEAGFPRVEMVSTGVATSEVSISSPSAELGQCLRNAFERAGIGPIGGVTVVPGRQVDIVIPIQYEGKLPSWSIPRGRCSSTNPNQSFMGWPDDNEVIPAETVEREYRRWLAGGRKSAHLPFRPCPNAN